MPANFCEAAAMGSRSTDDPMDLGGFMKTFVLNNPFDNGLSPTPCRAMRGAHTPTISQILATSKVVESPRKSPVTVLPMTTRSSAKQQESEKAIIIKDEQTRDIPLSSTENSPVNVQTVPEASVIDDDGLDAPLGYVGSNLAYAAALKMSRVSKLHPDVQKWLRENYRHIATYPGHIKIEELYKATKAEFPHMTSKKISLLMRVMFPDCAKMATKKGTYYRGLVAKPQPEDHCNVDLLKGLKLVRDNNRTLWQSATEAEVPLESLAGLYYWQEDNVDLTAWGGNTPSVFQGDILDNIETPLPSSLHEGTNGPRKSERAYNYRKAIKKPSHFDAFYMYDAASSTEEAVEKNTPCQGAQKRKTGAKRKISRDVNGNSPVSDSNTTSKKERLERDETEVEYSDSDSSSIFDSTEVIEDFKSVLQTFLDQKAQPTACESKNPAAGDRSSPNSTSNQNSGLLGCVHVKDEPVTIGYDEGQSNESSNSHQTKVEDKNADKLDDNQDIELHLSASDNECLDLSTRSQSPKCNSDSRSKSPSNPDVSEVSHLQQQLTQQESQNSRLSMQNHHLAMELLVAKRQTADLQRALEKKDRDLAALAAEFQTVGQQFMALSHSFSVVMGGISSHPSVKDTGAEKSATARMIVP